MRVPSGLSLACLGIFKLVLADVDCTSDVEIASSEDAGKVREACETIYGDLTLAASFNDNINLDGLKYVRGSFTHEQCSWEMTPGNACPKPPALNISSTTLEGINGSFFLDGTGGLETLSFPKLRYVGKLLDLLAIDDLQHVDFTNLESVNRLYWNTKNLKTLKMNGLRSIGEGVYGEDTLQFKTVGQVESVDGFFKNPVHPEYDSGAVVHLDVDWMPKVSHVTVGWEFIDALKIDVKALDVTLGGPETTKMKIRSIGLGRGDIKIERATTLEDLWVGTFNVNATGSSRGPSIEHLSLPFDHLGGLYIWSWDNLRSIQLPPEAKNWKGFSLWVQDCDNLDFGSLRNAKNQTVWYWPTGGLWDLVIRGSVSNEFFDGFLQQNVSVEGIFNVEDTSGNLDCSIFEDWAATHQEEVDNICSSRNITRDDSSNGTKSEESNDDKKDDDETKLNGASGLFSTGWRFYVAEVVFIGLLLGMIEL